MHSNCYPVNENKPRLARQTFRRFVRNACTVWPATSTTLVNGVSITMSAGAVPNRNGQINRIIVVIWYYWSHLLSLNCLLRYIQKITALRWKNTVFRQNCVNRHWNYQQLWLCCFFGVKASFKIQYNTINNCWSK